VNLPSNVIFDPPLQSTMLEGEQLREQMMLLAHDLSSLYRSERRRAEELARAVRELEEACGSMVQSLAAVVDAKDSTTGDHIERATHYALTLTERVAPSLLQDPATRYGFLLHDIGKVGVPESILTKPTELTESEELMMRAHPSIGRRMLTRMSFLAGAIPVVECHHERWDGLGYPHGFRGSEIPLSARIFSLADAFDAMTHDRPYRSALTGEEAVEEIKKHAGTQFDPTLAEAFAELQRDGLVPA
jgi:HD-GYP domain-containing protein (c-di-GMP phosphodiesterase class II)